MLSQAAALVLETVQSSGARPRLFPNSLVINPSLTHSELHRNSMEIRWQGGNLLRS